MDRLRVLWTSSYIDTDSGCCLAYDHLELMLVFSVVIFVTVIVLILVILSDTEMLLHLK